MTLLTLPQPIASVSPPPFCPQAAMTPIVALFAPSTPRGNDPVPPGCKGQLSSPQCDCGDTGQGDSGTWTRDIITNDGLGVVVMERNSQQIERESWGRVGVCWQRDRGKYTG